ncbi:ATP-binding cassette domain-containing protein, partial [Asanoa sp. NPDC049573]|uniref:ATP-binding cassette domain-containing protein n=1 Tax=Asanoa sp. NPDC049573 TaxID=3155396 RepID=UPI003414105F
MSSDVVAFAGVTKRYGDVVAVDDVSLRIRRGDIYGLLGLNGAGKTTLIRLLPGMVRPTAGVVSVFGEPIGPRTRRVWARVGHLVEAPSAYPELTVLENLSLQAHRDVAGRAAATDEHLRHAAVPGGEAVIVGAWCHRRDLAGLPGVEVVDPPLPLRLVLPGRVAHQQVAEVVVQV